MNTTNSNQLSSDEIVALMSRIRSGQFDIVDEIQYLTAVNTLMSELVEYLERNQSAALAESRQH